MSVHDSKKIENNFRTQNDELKRLRQQNLISIRKTEKSIESCSKLIFNNVFHDLDISSVAYNR